MRSLRPWKRASSSLSSAVASSLRRAAALRQVPSFVPMDSCLRARLRLLGKAPAFDERVATVLGATRRGVRSLAEYVRSARGRPPPRESTRVFYARDLRSIQNAKSTLSCHQIPSQPQPLSVVGAGQRESRKRTLHWGFLRDDGREKATSLGGPSQALRQGEEEPEPKDTQDNHHRAASSLWREAKSLNRMRLIGSPKALEVCEAKWQQLNVLLNECLGFWNSSASTHAPRVFTCLSVKPHSPSSRPPPLPFPLGPASPF